MVGFLQPSRPLTAAPTAQARTQGELANNMAQAPMDSGLLHLPSPLEPSIVLVKELLLRKSSLSWPCAVQSEDSVTLPKDTENSGISSIGFTCAGLS